CLHDAALPQGDVADRAVAGENRGERPRARYGDDLARQRASSPRAGGAATDRRAPTPAHVRTGRAPATVRIGRDAARGRHAARDRVGGAVVYRDARTSPCGAICVGDDAAENRGKRRGTGGIDGGDVQQRILRRGGDSGRKLNLLTVSAPEIDGAGE